MDLIDALDIPRSLSPAAEGDQIFSRAVKFLDPGIVVIDYVDVPLAVHFHIRRTQGEIIIVVGIVFPDHQVLQQVEAEISEDRLAEISCILKS